MCVSVFAKEKIKQGMTLNCLQLSTVGCKEPEPVKIQIVRARRSARDLMKESKIFSGHETP